MAENEVRRDLATWPVSVDHRLDQNAKWIGDLTQRVTKLEIVPYADMVAASKLDALAARVSALESAASKCPSAPMPPRARAMPYEGDTMTHEDDERAIVDALRWALPLAREALANSSVLFSHGASAVDWAQYERAKAALEGQGNRVGGTVPESSAVTSASPAPPAPLVERMAEAFRKACIPAAFDIVSASEDGARAVLLVAAEELLGPHTRDEEGFFLGRAMHTKADILLAIDEALRARLARAKEAAR